MASSSQPDTDKKSALLGSDVAPQKPEIKSISIKEKLSGSVVGGDDEVNLAEKQTLEKEKEKAIRKMTRDSSATSPAVATAAEELMSHSRVITATAPTKDLVVTSVAEFERTGLRNRDGDRDRDVGKQSITIGPVEFVKTSSSTVVDTIGRETGIAGKSMCGSLWTCTFRLLSSSLANSTFREAQEKDRDRCKEGAGPATSPSVLSMAGK